VDAVLLQEIHGSQADLDLLSADIPDFAAFGSFINEATGGVAILVRSALFSDIAEVVPIEFDPGRCIMVFLPQAQRSLISSHVTPAYTLEKKQLLLFVRDVSRMQEVDTIMGGDFNFTTSTDSKFDLDMMQETANDDPLALFFDEAFGCLTELHQAQHTRKKVVGNRVTATKRLDRIYTSIAPAHLIGMWPYAATTHMFLDTTFPSDHIPIRAVIHIVFRRPPCSPRIPTWDTSHPQYLATTRLLFGGLPHPLLGWQTSPK
jgi:hypothetical protein